MKNIIKTCRQGFSLLEVLVSVFVVLIGLLGVATMIPAGRFEILQARKADMGADLSRAIMNSVVTQISNGWNPGAGDYYIVANDNGSLSARMKDGVSRVITTQCTQNVNDNRTFNGDDDPILIEGNNNQLQVELENGEAIGTGVYTAFATVVSLGNGYYEVTGLAVYRFNRESDQMDYKRGSYALMLDSSNKKRWYKIENVVSVSAAQSTLVTAVGEKSSRDTNVKYLGEIVGVCKKVVRIDDSYTAN